MQPKNAVKMLSVLNQMPQRHGPDAFFSFPGRSAAVSGHIQSLASKWHAFVYFSGFLQVIKLKQISKYQEESLSYVLYEVTV